MQSCSQCNVTLTEENGYKKGRRFQSRCRSCFNQYCQKRWTDRKLKAIEYKGGECCKCGYNHYYGALEFHHIDPLEKDSDWNKLRLKSWSDVIKELDKCILVCANCHREIHHELKLSL